jgi:2-keto-4-pentenoate hydratase/2-oxohepta-3-ene-1,7-dioic acid hydratase in catechol pathway
MSIDKIICVGKNYLDHAKELGDIVPEKPIIFLKPPSVLQQVTHWGAHLFVDFPTQDDVVQPECEIVLRVACDAYEMTRAEAMQAISHVSLGLDMTLRTRQTALKKQGHPWTTAKVFKDAAILGPWIVYEDFQDYEDREFELLLDEKICQSAKGSEMMMAPTDLLVYLSHFFPLKAGDIVYTGTPAGVTAISRETCATLSWGEYTYRVTWGYPRSF